MELNQILQVVVTAISGILGVAVGYGVIKERVAQAQRMNEDQEKRILSLEARGLNIIFKDDCHSARQECMNNFCAKFEEVKELIRDNRNIETSKFGEISEFMGWARARMGSLTGKKDDNG
jgi:hypothetical protein